LLNVFGGKITTYRKLAEHALQKLRPHLHAGGDWTAKSPLPGGDIADAKFARFRDGFAAKYCFLPERLSTHLCRLYGTRAEDVIAGAVKLEDLGQKFGPLLYEREALYLREREWAETAADVLERRTKHGLLMSSAERAAFANWFEERAADAA
ncbi:MAG: glycerol-3-phosphate dehydrogenase C-terminal domain-containing protein, partial [Pseudomonadota bacterium]